MGALLGTVTVSHNACYGSDALDGAGVRYACDTERQISVRDGTPRSANNEGAWRADPFLPRSAAY